MTKFSVLKPAILCVMCLCLAWPAFAQEGRDCETRSSEWSRTVREPTQAEAAEVAKLLTLTGFIEKSGTDEPLPHRALGVPHKRGGWNFKLHGSTDSPLNLSTFLFIPQQDWEFFMTYTGEWTGNIERDVELYKEVAIPGTILIQGALAEEVGTKTHIAHLIFKGRGDHCFSYADIDQWAVTFQKEGAGDVRFAGSGMVLETSFHSDKDDMQHYSNRELGISFAYPPHWGGVIFYDYRNNKQRNDLLAASGADYTLSFEAMTGELGVTVYYTRYDRESPYKITFYDSLPDTTFLDARSEQIIENPTAAVAGRPAGLEEWFFDPGESMNRKYVLFPNDWDDTMVEIRLSLITTALNTAPGFQDKGLDYVLALNDNNIALNQFISDFSKFLNSIEFAQ